MTATMSDYIGKCLTCIYWDKNGKQETGMCRRFPPTGPNGLSYVGEYYPRLPGRSS